jgi:acyl-CoA thioester hydrolase
LILEQTEFMDFMQLPIMHRATIPESYLDDMGHMNVMWYTYLFGQATGGLFDLIGLTDEYFATNQAGSFALEQRFRYLAEVRVGQSVTIRSRLLGHSTKLLHAIHVMTKDEGQVVAATGEFVGAHMDMRVRRTSPFPPQILESLDRLVAEHNQMEANPKIRWTMKI